jgi:toxin ParE1/3/4
MSQGKVHRTRQSEEDLVEIWIYVADDSPRAADELLEKIEAKCSLLAANPELGAARDDIAPSLRFLPVGRYLILYRIREDGIEVVRVVHGARYLPNLLSYSRVTPRNE